MSAAISSAERETLKIGVLVRHRLGLQAARQRGRHRVLRARSTSGETPRCTISFLCRGPVRRHPGDREAAEERRRDVVRVALELGREGEQRLGESISTIPSSSPFAAMMPDTMAAPDEPIPARAGCVLCGDERRGRQLLAVGREGVRDRAHDQVALVGGHLARADALHLDGRAGLRRATVTSSSS